MMMVECDCWAELVRVVENSLAEQRLDYKLYHSSAVTCAFKLVSQPFVQLGCSQQKTIQARSCVPRKK